MLIKVARNNFIYHTLFWLGVYLIWVFILRNYSFSVTRTLSVQFCYLVFITADYYTAVYFIVPRFLKKKKYAGFILSMTLLIAFSALLRAMVSVQMNLHVFNTVPPAFGRLYLDSTINIFIWVELIVTCKMILDRVYDQQQMAIMEKERVKHELDFLKAQINPHAIFNSLNSIYGHIDKNNQTARNILLQFSGLLRYQLYDCMADKISLDKEIEYISNYVAFQQLRKDDNLIVLFDTDLQPGKFQIAPLLLVTLTENAFKFVGSPPGTQSRIAIKLCVKDNNFVFHIVNTTELLQTLIPAENGGIGLTNLKRRLELLYPGKHELTCGRRAACYEAELKIDLK